MDEWAVVVLLGAILTFIVGTMIPIITPLIKLNGVIQKNTAAINSLNKTVNELAVNNKEEHDRFNKDISKLKIDYGALKINHEKDVQMLGLNIKKG